MTRQMKLGLSLAGAMSFEHLARAAAIAEAGKFDFVCFAERPRGPDRVALDPLTVMAALAAVTSRIGLIATASTRIQDPFHLARKLASIDHLSEGRAGWDLVTGASPDEAQNFGPIAAMDTETRYERAREFQDVVKRLCTSWDADAFPRDVASGIYMERAKMRRLEHVGKHFKIRGPSDVARPPQGILPIMTAGTSENAQDFAAEFADIVYGRPLAIEAARAYYAASKARLPRYGRAPDSVRVMPCIMPVLGRTQQEADDLFGALPDKPGPQHGITGTPAKVADMMEDWFTTGAADGYLVSPSGVEDFVALVIPDLQRRGLFRKAYEGQTLRENLGLPLSR